MRRPCQSASALAATLALAHAHWKLNPPTRPSTSRISPTRKSPGQTREAIVAESISPRVDAARGDFRVVVAARAGDRQGPRDERVREPPAIGSRGRCARAGASARSSAATIAAAATPAAVVASAVGAEARGRSAAARVHQASTSSNRSPGQKLAVSATVRPSSPARSQWREASSVAGPLMPKCVQRSAPSIRRRHGPVGAHRELDVHRDAGQPPVQRLALREQQGNERRRRRNDRVAQTPRDVEPDAVAPALGQRSAAGGEHGVSRVQIALGHDDADALVGRHEVADATAGAQDDARRLRFPEQGGEDVARAVRVGEELAVGLLVQRDADRPEEGDRVGDGKARAGRGG